MKKIILLLIAIVSCSYLGTAQVQVSLNVDANPTPELSEWVNRNNLAIVTVTNTMPSLEGLKYRIKVKMLLNGERILETDNTTSILTLELGTETFLADDIIPYNSINFISQSFKNQLAKTGMLPPGSYSFCVSLVDLEGRVISRPDEACRPMIITAYQQPELIEPIDGKEIDPMLLPGLTFKWTPLVPIPSPETGVKYIIAVTEIQKGQTASQAFTVNYPVIEEEIIIGTQFTWPIDMEAPDEDQHYVWGIKTVTNEDHTFRATNNGFSTFGEFVIKGGSNGMTTKGQEEDNDCLCSDPQVINPTFTVIKPDPVQNPNTISISGISELAQAIKMCNIKDKIEDVFTTLIISWDSQHIENLPTGLGSYSHDYSSTSGHFNDNIPSEIHIIINKNSQVYGPECTMEYTIQVPKNILSENQFAGELTPNCENVDREALEELLSFLPQDPGSPETIQLMDMQVLSMNYMAQVLGGVDPSQFIIKANIDYGCIHNIAIWNSGMGTILDHDYDGEIIPHLPERVCITMNLYNKVTKKIDCTFRICKDIPQEFKDVIQENHGIEAQSEFDCGCEEGEVDTSVVTFTVPEDTPDNTVQINGLDTLYNNVSTCSIPEGEEYEGTTVVMDINWDPLHMTETMNPDGTSQHTFNELDEDLDHQILDTVCLDFLLTYPDGTTCRKVYCIPVPNDIFLEANDTQTCECTDLELDEPELNILVPEPIDHPRKLLLGNLITYRDYLLACNENYSLETHSMTVTIDWDDDHNEESIVGGGPFEHEYSIEHPIPTEICATFTIEPLFGGSEGFSCVTTKCVTVSEDLLALNVGVGDGELTLGQSIFAGYHVDGQGEFEIVTTTLTGTGPYSGTGTAYVGWLKTDITVEFTDITVDDDGNLVTGFITAQIHDTAPVYPIAWLIGIGGGLTFTHNHAEDLLSWISSTSGQEIDYDPATGAVMPVKMPLGVNFPSGDQLAITEMVFRASKSEFNLVAAKTTPPDWGPIQTVGFKAINIEFHPTSPVFPPERMELLEDITIGNINGKITFTFKSPTVDNPGCYIEWEETGFSAYGVELDVNFTRDWLIPLPDDGTSKAKANLVATGSAWGDLVLVGNLEECLISSTVPDPNSGVPTDSGAHDFIILADNISYDWSDIANAPAIDFPDIYTGETTNLFRGFHMEELTVKFSPNKINTPGGDPIEISINDMIIDDTGITLEAEIENLVVFGDAEVGDMAASIDRIYLEILSSSFVEAGVEGRIAIPVSEGNSLDNTLGYTALFNVPLDPAQNNNFQITLSPDQPITADLLKGTMTLDDTSNLTGYFDKDKKTFTMDLNGDFSWDDVQIGPVKNINFELGFEGVGFDYDTSLASNKLTFDAGDWAFASPQKKMANFPVTIDNIEYNSMTTTGNQLMHGKLNFDVIFNLSSKIGGMTTLGVEAAINDESGTGGKKFVPEFIGGVIDSIAIQADMAAVKIKGAIGFRNDDPVFGDGFIGSLSAEFKAAGIKVSALAEFGNTTYLNPSRYRYWRVEAEATFPSPGITFLPGLAFRGFGGGAFKNMEATLSGSTYTFTPKKSSFGFMAKAVLATTPKEETFNADVGLLGTFSGSGGMTYIGFTGDFYVGAGFDKRANAKIDGTLTVDYDFPQKHFNMSASVNVNAPPITTPSPMSLVLDINGKTNLWYFKFGEPANLNTVNVFGISLYEYLMFGNSIPYPGGFTNSFKTSYYNAVGTYPSAGGAATGGIGSNTQTGKGFALGIGFKFDKSGEKQLTHFGNGHKKHVLSFDLAAGAELHLSYMEYLGSCGGYSPVGINGWRAKGSLGMYGTAGAGVIRYRNNGSVRWSTTIASIAAGAWITGEFPNPYYVAGAIDGHITVFDLVSFSFHKDFEKGTTCGNGGAGSGAPVTQGDAAAEQENALIQYIHPENSVNFPTDKPLAVKYGLIPDEVFDVSEQQANGTVEMRTFKMVVTKNLKIKDDDTGVWSTVGLATDENNLGEYLYTKSSPIVILAPAPLFPALPPGGGGGGLPVAPVVLGGAYVAPLGFVPAAPPAPGMLAAPGGLMLYPAGPPSDDYDDLPPEPDPVVNSLTEDKFYKFTVTAALKEWNGTSWVNALKNDGSPVNQAIIKNFRTGPPVLLGGMAGPLLGY
jgi:hypothetical protein